MGQLFALLLLAHSFLILIFLLLLGMIIVCYVDGKVKQVEELMKALNS
jgi:hypothetical protein